MSTAPPTVAGHVLPGGHYLISPAEAAEIQHLALSPREGVHPAHATIISLRSLGVSIGGLCELCDFDLADGPFLGELSIEFHEDLQTDIDYRVSARIDGLTRHASRQLGLLDKLAFSVSIQRADGHPVSDLRYLWILPRGQST
ncbi:MAG: hypothetical protein ACO3IN_05310 [Steroidobacteraceae bacterium]